MSKKNNPGKTESMQIPDYAIERMARCLLPMIQRYNALREQNRDKETRLVAIQGDLRKLKEIRAWVDKVIPGLLPDPAERKQERSSVLAKLQDASPQPSVHPAKQKTQDMEH